MSQKCIDTGKSTHGRSGNAVISYAFCFILIILFLSGVEVLHDLLEVDGLECL